MFRIVQKGEQTQDQGSSDREVSVQVRQSRTDKLVDLAERHSVEHNVTKRVETTTTSTTSGLTVVERSQEDWVSREDNCLTRHIDTECKSTCRDYDSQVTSAEQDFNSVTVLAVHTSVMNTDTTLETLDEQLFDTTVTELLLLAE